jgi:hypothetical protein
MYRVGPLAAFSSLFHMRDTGSIYRDAIALRAIFGICPHNPSLGFLNRKHTGAGRAAAVQTRCRGSGHAAQDGEHNDFGRDS